MGEGSFLFQHVKGMRRSGERQARTPPLPLCGVKIRGGAKGSLARCMAPRARLECIK
jgi:hypothetical protein